MHKKDRTVAATKIFTWLVLAAIAAFLAAAPWCVNWYAAQRGLDERLSAVLLVCVYAATVPAAAAMVHMLLLLREISREQVFTVACVRHISVISWCCLAAAVIVGGAGADYLPLLLIAGALLFMFLITRVVCSVMRAAVEIKNENSLTI